jgi:hypothetical protein
MHGACHATFEVIDAAPVEEAIRGDRALIDDDLAPTPTWA